MVESLSHILLFCFVVGFSLLVFLSVTGIHPLIGNAVTINSINGEHFRGNLKSPPVSSSIESSTFTVHSNEIEEFSLYINTTMSFMEALISCGEEGMQLAIIKSAEEQDKVVALIKKTGQRLPFVLSADFWISGLKIEESDFSWFRAQGHDLSDMGYTNWNDEQPNIYTKKGMIFFWQGCVFLDHEHEYRWNTSHCDDTVNYAVCEKIRD